MENTEWRDTSECGVSGYIHGGTNNLDKDSLAEIKKGITSVAYVILKRKPCVNIIVTGLLPRDSKGSPRRQQISWINERLEHWCNNLAKKNVLFLKPNTDWNQTEWSTKGRTIFPRFATPQRERKL